MKKSLFYWAFLVVAGISLTACSSGDDNIADNTTPVTPDSQNKTVILTGTIGVGGDETRAVSDAGVKSWQKDDPITIYYETTTAGVFDKAVGTIKDISSDAHFASFEATLNNPKNDGNIGFAYGTVKEKNPTNAYGFEFDYSAYSNQEGTTATITSNGLDYACTEESDVIKMAIKDGKATLKGNAMLTNKFSMYKFTLNDGQTNPTGVPARQLVITVADGADFGSPKATYTITPNNSNSYSVFYVALEPKETGDKVKIVASFDGNPAAIKLDDDSKLSEISYGKFLCVDANDTYRQAYLCSSSTTPKVCEYTYGTNTVFEKGKFYSKDLVVKELTPTAVIAYVGKITNYCDNFLALALENVYEGVKNFTEARALISQDNNWAVQNKLTIVNKIYSDQGLKSTSGKYDVVKECAQISGSDNHIDPVKAVSSQSRTANVIKGWRLPSVTDIRYIFDAFRWFNGTDYVKVMQTVTPTNPIGIMDHNGMYYTNGSSNYFRDGTGRPDDDKQSSLQFINALCGNDKMLKQYYWLSSQVTKSNEEEPTAGLAWRYSFANEYFIWTSEADNSLARLVFAY